MSEPALVSTRKFYWPTKHDMGTCQYQMNSSFAQRGAVARRCWRTERVAIRGDVRLAWFAFLLPAVVPFDFPALNLTVPSTLSPQTTSHDHHDPDTTLK